MSKYNIIIFFFLIISISPKDKNEEYCQKIQCYPDLDSNTCIKIDSSITLLKPCPSSLMCDNSNEDPIDDKTCEDKSKIIIPFKKLPSLPCNDSSECISNICMNNQCQGIKDGDSCHFSYECYYGKTCRKEGKIYKCLDPVKEGEKCEIDTDCEINCGCKNGKCTKYFSLNNWEKTDGKDFGQDLNLCKSGYANELGFCMNISLKNDVTECSPDSYCQYEYKDENNEIQNIIIHQNCLCGYNPFGKRYCLLGSGNANYTRYIEKLKEYHMNNSNCHLSERSAEGCQKDLLSNSKEVLTKIRELKNAQYWAKANNRLIEAPECAYSVLLPDYDRSLDINQIPEPISEGKCAKYFCKGSINGGTCALSNYKNNFDINVSLADICEEGVKCNLGGNPNDIFYNGTNKECKCGKLEIKRYPGEQCNLDTECVYPLNNPSSQFHKCEDNKCNGIEKDGICEDNSWCVVGYYCDKREGKCKSQLKNGKNCLESTDCKNNLVCINNKCEELFSLNDGETVPEHESYEFQKMFCKNLEVINNKCVSFNDLDNKKVKDDEYKTCDYNSYCEYKVNGLEYGKKKFVKCGCGYNDKGQGYCPHYHDYSKDDWDKYRELWKKRSDNDCHTESRFNCYEYDEEDSYELKQYKNKLEKGHLFYGCVECAKKVLDSNYIRLNKFLIFILIWFATFFI